jgi:Ca2+-transporting ATPase
MQNNNLAMWASEPVPFVNGKTLHKEYARTTSNDIRVNFRMIHEYPLGGKPPMMTHIFQDESGTKDNCC